MPNHPPAQGRLPFLSSQYRAMKSAIEEELRAPYQPADQLSPELRRLPRQIPCSDIRDAAAKKRMKCGLLTTNRVVSLKVRFISQAAKAGRTWVCGVIRLNARVTLHTTSDCSIALVTRSPKNHTKVWVKVTNATSAPHLLAPLGFVTRPLSGTCPPRCFGA